ncbi:ATP-dependent Clp protease adaptor protein ClpS, putative [Plasmodium chabaudi adami]|uniref:ATP-dependent Clp protease adaptor protein ClpS, putative n=2 Tax=Plasmodium chabaudi TaxID=5825 RepID=A0A1C6YSB1_PLACU|nr:ATP-dependent Clp protease adaptor protein ClpS, putative [Plasmodium chabaudi chabaudi]SCN62791.1 ATP-dependent Clp protease adaptor protein ClpS, putative [Plasmodium chabaudi adami]
MTKYLNILFFALLYIYFFKRTYTYNKQNFNNHLNFINSQKFKIISNHRYIYNSPLKSKNKKNVIYATGDANLENIKKLRNVVKDIKKENKREYEDEEKLKREKEAYAWKVILYNDDIHNFTYVTDVIVKVIGYISKAKAHTITVEAHSTGQALILSTWKAKAEMYCEELQKNGLTVSIIHESQLKGDNNMES